MGERQGCAFCIVAQNVRWGGQLATVERSTKDQKKAYANGGGMSLWQSQKSKTSLVYKVQGYIFEIK